MPPHGRRAGGCLLVKSGASQAVVRCRWAQSPEMIRYHDQEWGVPVHDDTKLFEFLILEGAQAGLSWETIPEEARKLPPRLRWFRRQEIARYGAKKTNALMKDSGIVRNRLRFPRPFRTRRHSSRRRRNLAALIATSGNSRPRQVRPRPRSV